MSAGLAARKNWIMANSTLSEGHITFSQSTSLTSKPDPSKEWNEGESYESLKVKEEPVNWNKPPIHLPDEIIIQIVEYVSHSRQAQYALASCCLLSHQWYSASIAFLYARPWITGKNFDAFARVIIPSRNLHVRKSPLSELVKLLDMSQLIHSSSKRVTARLIGRTKNSLEDFIAPQASFGPNSFAALSKCENLRLLDLGLVSESPPLLQLFKATSQLHRLKTLRLPRSSGFSNADFDASAVRWPPNLEILCLSGGIDAHFQQGVISFPDSLKSLSIEHCPTARTIAILHLIRTAIRPLPNLEVLRLANLTRLASRSLDNMLLELPGLTKLSVSVDYITPMIFELSGAHERSQILSAAGLSLPESSRHRWLPGRSCQLRTLELTNSGNPGVEDKITPIDILIAVQDGTLPNLRQVRVANSLFWHSQPNAAETDALADALKESATEKGEQPEATGVWTFDG